MPQIAAIPRCHPLRSIAAVRFHAFKAKENTMPSAASLRSVTRKMRGHPRFRATDAINGSPVLRGDIPGPQS
ncbi:hypothetical protein KCP70_23385 [Salmonella enterica subsp. enterica]|nr:hypothetical protein KCP70_23385 [Salmonella enterica subsp. enterica]